MRKDINRHFTSDGKKFRLPKEKFFAENKFQMWHKGKFLILIPSCNEWRRKWILDYISSWTLSRKNFLCKYNKFLTLLGTIISRICLQRRESERRKVRATHFNVCYLCLCFYDFPAQSLDKHFSINFNKFWIDNYLRGN